MSQQVMLVPLDGSAAAEAALPYAEAVAGLLHTGLRFLRVVEPFEDAPWGLTERVRQRMQEQRRSEAERYLDAVERGCRERGFDTAAEVRVGEPTDRILEAAAAADVSLIAMSTHGRRGVQRLLLGSVADKVLRLGTHPTLLVRAGEAGKTGAPPVLKRIMAPLDGSELAEQALPLACQLAQASGATLVLVRAEEHLWQWPAGLEADPHLGERDEEVTQAITVYLERVRSNLPAALQVELSPCRGYPAMALQEMVLNGGIGLVVMATHGRGGMRRLAIGSMAERLVRLGAPMLLVRSVPAAEPATTEHAMSDHPG